MKLRCYTIATCWWFRR